MKSLLRAADQTIVVLVKTGMFISASLILLVAVAGAVDVATTNVIRWSVPIVSEISSDALAVIIFMAIAYPQYRDEHVAVDIIKNFFPTRLRGIMNLLVLVVGVVFLSLLTWRAAVLAGSSYGFREGAMAAITYPVYPFKIAVFLGLLICTLEVCRQIVWMLLTGLRESGVRKTSVESER